MAAAGKLEVSHRSVSLVVCLNGPNSEHSGESSVPVIMDRGLPFLQLIEGSQELQELNTKFSMIIFANGLNVFCVKF